MQEIKKGTGCHAIILARSRHGVGDEWIESVEQKAELNLSSHPQQLSSMQVNLRAVMRAIVRELMRHYQFINILETGDALIKVEEATILRDHLLNGSFLLAHEKGRGLYRDQLEHRSRRQL